MLNIAMRTMMFVILASSAAATDKPLVQCSVPVDVEFIVTAGLRQPEFNEVTKPGQQHWSAYKCQMHVQEREDGAVEDLLFPSDVPLAYQQWGFSRQLLSVSNSTDDDNETESTTTSPPATITSTAATQSSTTANLTGNSTTNLTKAPVSAEIAGACRWKSWTAGLFSLSLSMSLPVALAAPGTFMVPSQPRKLTAQIDVVEVLMPCSAMSGPLRDLDGDGTVDCLMTKEQHEVAVSVPEVDGTWHIVTAHSVSSGSSPSEASPSQESITIDGGVLCTESSPTIQWDKEKLPLALTHVEAFTHDAKPCGSGEVCQATMWAFDLTYPASSCTPGIAAWAQPCSAKLLADGTLVLLRGPAVPLGSGARQPPLMINVADSADALPFANGLAAATGSRFEVLLLRKFEEVSIQELPIQWGRQLLSASNFSDDDNETDITTTQPPPATTSTAGATTTANSSGNSTNATTTQKVKSAEIAHALNLQVGFPVLLCLMVYLLN